MKFIENAGGRKFLLKAFAMILLFASAGLGFIDGSVAVGGITALAIGYGVENVLQKKVLKTDEIGGKKK
jgi:multisubunit Na+/H+ antiporter MnhB subunit